jgi:hypothetical protein
MRGANTDHNAVGVAKDARYLTYDLDQPSIEAGCKTLIATRLKRSGMFWTVRGVIAVRCCRHSSEFDDYWESRRP